MGRRTRLRIVIPTIAIGLLVVFAVVGALSRGGLPRISGLPGISSQQAAERTSATPDSAGAPMSSEAMQGVDGGGDSKGAGLDIAAAVPPASALSAHHLLRTGDLSLLVARGTLLSSVDRINAMTVGMGGYVMSSALGSESPGMPGPVEPLALDAGTVPSAGDQPTTTVGTNPYATLTVRVPESSFDAALKRFAALGDVQSVSTSSEDVTSQYVDLQARLRHYRAVERRLVRFLDATDNVNQTLAVQDRIDNVQLTIEQLSAQLKSLRETTTYGTLSVFLREKGTPQAGANDPSDTFTGTLLNSIKVLGHGSRVTGLVLTALLPFVIVFGGIGFVVWFVVRRARRGRRQPAQPSLPA
ncbi:MAG: DUF4349 domain-containing protein, partial [Actinobacteria bacterium]|nr:DUF4349 domain-containing protein [Actinomycetota bacterium]